MEDRLHEKRTAGTHLGWVGGVKCLRACWDDSRWVRTIASGIGKGKSG